MDRSRIKMAGLAIIFVLILVLVRQLELTSRIDDLKTWIGSLGPLAPIAFIGFYALAAVLALPGSALTVLGGAIFGSFWGVVYVIFAATLGATLSFCIARYAARNAIKSWLGDNAQFQKLDNMTEKHGAVIVALTRLVPIFPFNVLNYGFGLTNVPLSTYVLWSFICMIPGTALYVVGADALTQGLAQGQVPWGLLGVLLIVLGILTMIVRKAKQILKDKDA